MPEWAGNPFLWIVVAIAVGGLIFGAGKWVGAVNSDRASFSAFTKEIRDDIKKILDRLPSQTVSSSSPLQLTELGRTISVRISALSIAEELAAVVREQVRGRQAYEIQEICFDYVLKQYEPREDQEAVIKECAYENGIDLEQVMKVIAVELRDFLLRER